MRNNPFVASRRARVARTQARPRKLFAETLESRWMLAQTTGLFFNNPGASDGYTLISPNTAKTTYLLDSQGSVVNQWQSSYTPGLLGYLLPDGSLIRDGAPHGQGGNGSINAAGAGGLLERFNWDGTKIWEYSYDSTTHLAHHDFEVLPNGNVLLIAWELKTEAEATQAGRDPNLPGAGYLYPDSIVEVQPDLVQGGGTVVWEWHVWDHLVQQFDSSKNNWHGSTGVAQHPELIDLNYVSVFDEGGGQAEDWTHSNGIDYNAELDEIVLSVREFSEVWIIDHSTTTAQAASHSGGNRGKGGDLLYRWGNPQTYDAGTASDRVLYYQHDARWIPDGSPGAGNITVFNNGFGRPGDDFSEVDEFTPPLVAGGGYSLVPGQAYGPTTTAWTYQAPLPYFSAIISGAQRLPNGNTRVSYGVSGTFTEVTPDGQEVWKYVNPYTGGGPLGPTTPIPSLGLTDPGLDALLVNFTFQSIQYPRTYVTQLLTSVADRGLFYANSFYDDDALVPGTAGHDAARASDKVALLSGPATFANYSSYDRGINGIQVDLTSGGAHANLTTTLAAVINANFTFRVSGPLAGDDFNNPATWTTLVGSNLPVSITNRAGKGVGGSDRLDILWADGTILGTWLQVTVKANADTGLGVDDVFYFGNLPGETGDDPNSEFQFVDANDQLAARVFSDAAHANLFQQLGLTAAIQNRWDLDRDNRVDVDDQQVVRANMQFPRGELDMINIAGAQAASIQVDALPAKLPVFSSGGDTGAAAAVASALVILDDGLDSQSYVPVMLYPLPQAVELKPPLATGPTSSAVQVADSQQPRHVASENQDIEDPWEDDELLNSLLGWDSPV